MDPIATKTGKLIAKEPKKRYIKHKNSYKSDKLQFIFLSMLFGLICSILPLIHIESNGLRIALNTILLFSLLFFGILIFLYFMLIWSPKRKCLLRSRVMVYENGISPGFRPNKHAKNNKAIFVQWSDVIKIEKISIYFSSSEKWGYRFKTKHTHIQSFDLWHDEFSKADVNKVLEKILEIQNNL